ncbi:uracil-DNA glycosylase [Chitinivorax sp. B]|uniref:uracil-DNA glycosylase n=1 Tax=Chitinivorax sp. B TaxID=2502235 RepID=UPI0010F46664|nr:uracil-DNA glycosylase [Chitinivorax sp. B]
MSTNRLIAELQSFEGNEKLFNPWRQRCEEFDRSDDAPKQKATRLATHLNNPAAKLMLLGEAAGYQGCRYSGITFTSEKLLLSGTIPRIEQLTERLTHRRLPFCEPSATIVWGALYQLGLADQTILWNTLPFHPHKGEALSNRTPTTTEIKLGAGYLQMLLDSLANDVPLIAVGNKAQQALSLINVKPFATVRHPAMGGANQFREGMHQVAQRLRSPTERTT